MISLPKGVAVGMKEILETTYNHKVASKVGDYAGLYEWGDSYLVSSTDGVGTKLVLACEEYLEHGQVNVHEGIGEDLVNHCVNDILVMGARPLFFLNTFSYSHKTAAYLQPSLTTGMARAAIKVGMPIISGETAKMEGFYPYASNCGYDLVGTIIGSVSRSELVDGRDVGSKNKLIGIPSNGLHTNGYTLVREIFGQGTEEHKLWTSDRDFGESFRMVLLERHRCYYDLVKPMLDKFPINGMVHVTGGGIEANLKRIVNENNHLIRINWSWLKENDLWSYIQKHGKLSDDEMRKNFNMGIGFILIVPEKQEQSILTYLRVLGETPISMGEIV